MWWSLVNRKGQALVEFMLILPVFLMILFTIIDFGLLAYSKNRLENESTDMLRLIQNGDNLDNIKTIYPNVEIQISTYEKEYQKIIFEQKVSLITPFLERILGNPCSVQVERIIPNVE